MQAQNASELKIEKSSDLEEWVTVPITPEMLDGEGNILVPTGGVREFYRLKSSLIEAPVITSLPTAIHVLPGNSAELMVAVTGTSPLKYQWYEGAIGNLTNPVGTNSPNFITPPLAVEKNYWVRVSNAAGTVDSRLFQITVGGSDGKPVIAKISALGDSITGGVNLGETRSIATLGSYLSPAIFFDTGLSLVGSTTGTNFQTGGLMVQQIIDTWLPQVLVSGTDLCVVHAGTNSLNDSLAAGAGNGNTDAAAAWLFAQLVTIMNSLESAGIHCVICTITPDDHTTTTSQMRTVRAKTNALIRSSPISHGAVVCDWAPELSSDPEDDTAIANTLYLSDNVHPSACGVWRMGRKLVETLRTNFTLLGTPDYPPDGDDAWMTPNPYLVGDVSGLATSFTKSTSGTPAVTISPTKTPEGWQRIQFSGGGSPGSNISGTVQVASPQFTDSRLDGRRFKAVFDVRPVESDFRFFAIRPNLIAATFDGGIQRNGYAVSAYGSSQMTNEKTVLDFNSRFVFETPVMEHPGGTGTQRRQLIARIAFWGSGTVNLRLMGVIEVD